MTAVPAALIDSLRRARHVAVFTGAGVSAESGIPTFRDHLTGLWQRFDAAELASADGFLSDPELVWGWYEWRRARMLAAQPNAAHRAIAELARRVERLTLITQNVDDLHERAGSSGVIHLHGEIQQARCFDCGAPHRFAAGIPDEPEGGRRLAPPPCARCGGPVRPGVVWFGEALPVDALRQAEAAAEDADLFLTVGTSALVYPAADLPYLAAGAGKTVVQVNPNETALDRIALHNLRGAAGAILPALVAQLPPRPAT